MNCPVCSTLLQPTERLGVEIDVCFNCGGIWLDRGELEKITQLSTWQSQNSDGRDEAETNGRPSSRRGGGFLGRLFDFDRG
jgi:Zn-finger nucleic acid-binding protein